MKFFSHFKHSVYSPSFYHDRKVAPLGHAFGYFFILILCTSVIATIVFMLLGVPKLQKYTSPEFVSQVVSYFPAELTVTLKGGQASTNVSEPYAIPIPATLFSELQMKPAGSRVENFIVIDTTHPFVLTDFASYKTALLLTKDFIVVEDRNGKITVNPLKSFPDAVIDQTLVLNLMNKAVPYIKTLTPLLIPIVLIGSYIGYVIGYLFLLLISSLIVWIVYMIQKKGITYGTCYKLGLYAVTLPIIIDLILSATSIGSSPWYVTLILILIVMLANIRDAEPAHI